MLENQKDYNPLLVAQTSGQNHKKRIIRAVIIVVIIAIGIIWLVSTHSK